MAFVCSACSVIRTTVSLLCLIVFGQCESGLAQTTFCKDSISFDTLKAIPKTNAPKDFVLYVLMHEYSCKSCYGFIGKCLQELDADSSTYTIVGINYFTDSNEIPLKQIELEGYIPNAHQRILLNMQDYHNLVQTMHQRKPELLLYHQQQYYPIRYHQLYNIYSGVKPGYDCQTILAAIMKGFVEHFASKSKQ